MQQAGTPPLTDRQRRPPPNVGDFDSEQEALDFLVARLVAELHPLRIVLFGSRAERRARPDSDFDLLVVLPDDASDADLDFDRAYAPVLGSGIGCDVVPCREGEYRAILSDPTDPWQGPYARGRPVYERA